MRIEEEATLKSVLKSGVSLFLGGSLYNEIAHLKN